jgi:hypothetical protein
MSPEFKEEFIERWNQNPSEYIEAFCWLGGIIAIILFVIAYKLSIRFMITYIYLKTGTLLSKHDGVKRIKDTFKQID